MVKTVIFDMDGLLINSEPYWKMAMKEVFAEMDITFTEEEYERTVGLPTSEIVEYWSAFVDWQGKTEQQVCTEILDNAKSKILAHGTLMEGALYLLNFFKEKGFKMGLASSSPMMMIKAVLDKFELEQYFEALHSGEHHEYGKPHPAVYLACAKELKADPVYCLVFEDSINGMIAAKAAKMKVVAVPEEHNKDDKRYTLADAQLPALKEFTEETLKKLQG